MPRAKNPKLEHLKLRGKSWYLSVPIPTSLRGLYLTSKGAPMTHIVRALNTTNEDEAYRRKLEPLAEILADFELKRQEQAGEIVPPLVEARHLRRDYQRALKEQNRPPTHGGGPSTREFIAIMADDLAESVAEAGGNSEDALRDAQLVASVALGKETLDEAFDEWLSKTTLPLRTQAKYRTALQEFLRFLGPGHHLIDAMDRQAAIDYADWLNSEARSQRTKKAVPLSYNSKRDRIMALSVFWGKGLSARGKAFGHNPWTRVTESITKTPTPSSIKWDNLENTGRPKRREGFTTEDLIAIYDHQGTKESHRTTHTKQTMMEVLTLALFTGARPEEICSLTLGDIKESHGAYWLSITDAKNDASDRTIPVAHPAGKALVARRVAQGKGKGKHQQLFPELKAKKGGDSLYELLGRALGRHIKASGVSGGLVPYCARHTLMTLLGNRPDVKDAELQTYVGHKPKSMMDQHYRVISQESLLSLAQKIEYPPEVESRFFRELGIK